MNLQSFQTATRLALAAVMTALLCAPPAKADMIELTNGDHYRGVVVSMTQSNLEFMSEIQGLVKLPRSKIAQITLHEVVAKQVIVSNAPAPVAAAAVTAPGKTVPTADAVVQQMRQQGVDPKLIDQIQEQIFGKASPEAAKQFNDTVAGLTTGQISVRDIRSQAQGAIAQIKAAKKELGPDAGDMLDGYLEILQSFVNESAAEDAAPAAPATTK